MVVDAGWTVQLANQAALRMLTFLLGERFDPSVPVNFMKLPLHPQGARPYLTNWPEIAGSLLHRLQREAMDSPAAAGVLAEVRGYPDVDALWRNVDWEAEPQPLLQFRVEKDGLSLNLVTMIATFGTPQDVTLQDLRIESFLPADEATEHLLRSLAGN